MKLIIPLFFSAAVVFGAEPRIQRDVPYAEPKNVRQTLDVYAPPNAILQFVTAQLKTAPSKATR